MKADQNIKDQSIKLVAQADRTPELIHQLVLVWESAVRATHLFLSESEIQKIKEYVPQALSGVAHLVVEKGTLEMLFVSAEERGRGIERWLLQYGMREFGVEWLAVNEQNPQAQGFYERMGFRVYKRTDFDEQGNPYPLLYMSLV